MIESAILLYVLIALSVFLLAAVIVLWWKFSSSRKFVSSLIKERTHAISIIKQLSDGLIEYDRNYTILFVNKRAEEILGTKKENLLYKKITEDFIEASLLYKIIFAKEAAGTGFAQLDDLRISTVEIKDEQGNVIGFLKVLHDISRENLMIKTKSEFITVAAHQLRTPLSVNKWKLNGLLEGELGPLTAEQVQAVRDGYVTNERMIQLVNNLLDVASIEEGKFGYKLVYGSIEGVVHDIVAKFQPLAKIKNIGLRFVEPIGHVPEFSFDPVRISMALGNLVDNALTYNKDGGTVELTAGVQGGHVFISVQDTGIGISALEEGRLFTKFFRGETAVRMETEGSGLGLFITKSIVSSHGGTVDYISEKGKGTTFTIRLPLQKERS